MTTTDISIYRGLKSTYNPDNHIGFYITTDTNELLLNNKSLGLAVINWELIDGILYLVLNTGKTITIPFPDATSTTRGLMTAKDHIKLSELPNSQEIQLFINEAIENYAIPEYVTQHILDTNNPHLVTKAQLGLGNVDNTSDVNKPISVLTQTALNKKVDKEDGKILSSNDYTNEDKLKLQGIEEGALVNSVTSVSGKTGAIILSKSDVGLNLVDNTSDLNKPISIPQQEAFNNLELKLALLDNTIENAKQELSESINSVKESIIGTLEDTLQNNTIYGVKKYAESIIPTIELDSSVDMQYDLKVNGQSIGIINIPEDLFLLDVLYNSHIITFIFKTSEGQKTIPVNISDLVDTYNAGNGLVLNESVFSIKLDPLSESYLSLNKDGLKLEGINSVLDTKADITSVYTKNEIDLKNYATLEYVTTSSIEAKDYTDLLIANAITSGTIDLSAYLTIENANSIYATKDGLDSSNTRIASLEAIDHSLYLTEHQSLENYYTKVETESLINSIEVPSKTSDLINDSEFITDISDLATKEELSSLATEVSNIEIPSIDGLLSKETADILYLNKGEYLTSSDLVSIDNRLQSLESIDHSLYLIEHLSLENYYNKAEVDTKITDAVTAGTVDLSNYYNKQLTDALLPTKTSDLVNDSGFISDISSLATKEELDSISSLIPSTEGLLSKTLADLLYLEKGDYLTEHQSLEGYARIEDIPSISVSSDINGNIISINGVNNLLSNVTTLSDGEMSKEDKIKLDSIESGALVNVLSDWNAVEGDSFILNKPTELSQFNLDTEHRLVTDAEKNIWNNKQDLISDLYIIRSNSELGASAILEETDPTVPSWAKLETKPSYTKDEIGLGNVDNVSSILIKLDIIGSDTDTSDLLTLLGVKKYAESVSSGVNNYTVNGKLISTNPIITKEDVNLGNVTNESKETMFTNPSFTGIPTAPTADNGTNTTLVATTAFVQNLLPTIATSSKEGLVKSASLDLITSDGVDRYVEVLEDGLMKVNIPSSSSSTVNSILTWGAGIDSTTPTNLKSFMKVENDDGSVTFHKMFSALLIINRGKTIGYYNPALATTDNTFTNLWVTIDITDDFSEEDSILRPTVLYSAILSFESSSGWSFMNPTRALDNSFIYHLYGSDYDCHIITYNGNSSILTDNDDGTIHLVSYTPTISSVLVTPLLKDKDDSEFNKYDIIVRSYWGSPNNIYIYYRDRATGNILTDLNVSDEYLLFSITFLGHITKTEIDISTS